MKSPGADACHGERGCSPRSIDRHPPAGGVPAEPKYRAGELCAALDDTDTFQTARRQGEQRVGDDGTPPPSGASRKMPREPVTAVAFGLGLVGLIALVAWAGRQ